MSKTVAFNKPPQPAPPTQTAEAWVKPPVSLPPAPAKELVEKKRLTVDLPETLHTRLKLQCVRQRRQAYDLVHDIIERAVTDMEAEHAA
jgi:hypothetical protein